MVRLNKNVGGGLQVSVEGETMTEAFEQMSMIEECFQPNPDEKSDGNFQLRVRDVTDSKGEDFRYYELYDASTKARLSLGQYKQKDKAGFLFPKRKDGETWLENRGWVVYKPANANPATPAAPTKEDTRAGKKKKDAETPF